MRAVWLEKHGGPEVLKVSERPEPVREPWDALVEVRACGLNHLDIWVRKGGARSFPLPLVPGSDAAGVILEAPKGSDLKPGDEVVIYPCEGCGKCAACERGDEQLCTEFRIYGAARDGGYAELVKAPAANMVPLPEAISFEAGAAVPLAMLTSWHALIAQAQLRPGQTVLVQAAGSGVGSAAIQIARLVGARVMTTVGSDDKIAFARALGAEHVVNYRTQDFVEEAKRWTGKRGVDVVVEHIGGDTFERSSYALTRLGTLVSIGSHDTHWGRLDLRHVYSKNLKILGTNLGSILELRTILDYIAAGRLQPVIDRAFQLPDARAAVQHVLDRKNKGKVLLVP